MSTAYDSVEIRTPDGATSAQFVPAANMLGCSLRHRDIELLEFGGVSDYVERGKTTGIPLLHPWANRIDGFEFDAAGKRTVLPQDDDRIPRDPVGNPIHGVLPGLLRWEPASAQDQDRLEARLSWDSPELLELFPFVHELQIEARVSVGELTITTTLRASGEDTVPVSFGYHPYLTLPGSDRRSWEVTLGAFRRLVVDERLIPTGEREPVSQRTFRLEDRSLDDGFDALTVPAEFEVADAKHKVTVTFLEGYHYAQVWAPPGRNLICIEPMTAPTNALRSGDGLVLVEPGGDYRATFSITVADSSS